MTNQCSTDQIKATHDNLYQKAVRDAQNLANNNKKRNYFIKKIKDLLAEIHCTAGQVRTIDEYRMLSEMVTSWQVVIASTLNVPMVLDSLPMPPKRLLQPLPYDKALTEKELDDWRLKLSEILGLSRLSILGRPSSTEEMKMDWYNTHVFLALDILNGFPNFASRIATRSYWRLEEIWAKTVKRLKAYFIWERGGGISDPLAEKEDYYQACEHIRKMLVNKEIKARLDEFERPKTYIEDRYLLDGRIDISKPATKHMLQKKANRIWEVTGEKDMTKNHRNAMIYTRMFYENIIPAVIENDEEKCLTVLKAFQYSKAPENGWWIVNCFEVALVIYFINPDIIQKLWDDAVGKTTPKSSIESVVQVQSWPEGLKVPKHCIGRFNFDGKYISFQGLMTKTQKKSLIEMLKNRNHRSDIENLFFQSRLIHRKTTL